jgi:hypothetical protein
MIVDARNNIVDHVPTKCGKPKIYRVHSTHKLNMFRFCGSLLDQKYHKTTGEK